MAAPQSTPDLSVVEPEKVEPEATAADSSQAIDEKPSVAPAEKAPEPPAAAPAQPARSARRGVPVWVLLVVLVVGAALYASQYQQVQVLDAQVISLQGELAEAGAQLEAYQSHLGSVRSSVADLKQQIGSLDTLVNLDPLAVAVSESVELDAPAFLPSEPATANADELARDSVVGSALAAPGVAAELEDLAPFGAPGPYQGPGF
jgi:uncharacterized protein HemX